MSAQVYELVLQPYNLFQLYVDDDGRVRPTTDIEKPRTYQNSSFYDPALKMIVHRGANIVQPDMISVPTWDVPKESLDEQILSQLPYIIEAAYDIIGEDLNIWLVWKELPNNMLSFGVFGNSWKGVGNTHSKFEKFVNQYLSMKIFW